MITVNRTIRNAATTATPIEPKMMIFFIRGDRGALGALGAC